LKDSIKYSLKDSIKYSLKDSIKYKSVIFYKIFFERKINNVLEKKIYKSKNWRIKKVYKI
jgi:hypothetical protein